MIQVKPVIKPSMPLRSQAVTWYFQLPHKHGSELAFNKFPPSSTLTTPKSIWQKKDKEECLKKNPRQNLSAEA